MQEVVLGRAAGGVTLDDPYASERHVSFFRSSKGLFALDLMSTNGIWVNGERVAGSAPFASARACAGRACIWVVVPDGALWVGSPRAPGVWRSSCQSTEQDRGACGLGPRKRHGPGNAFAAQGTPVTQVAPEAHAQPAQLPVAPVVVSVVPAAKPAVASTSAVPEYAASPCTDTLRIDIEEKNVWSRLKKKTILRDVHLTVEPGELVLILGGSGAGKSTFINAVMGNDKAEGTIKLGDRDVYEEYERIKYQIGYVPQQDLLRGNDTVRDTLMAAAQLRMPANTPRAECAARAQWAGELLGLKREGDTLAGRLSGGQRKRLSIAIELVGDPALFFLDEPDSGLDGIMSRTLMENLRGIADLGKIVMVITHGPDRAADLFSKVIVLAKAERDGAGHLLFCGPWTRPSSSLRPIPSKASCGASTVPMRAARVLPMPISKSGRDSSMDMTQAGPIRQMRVCFERCVRAFVNDKEYKTFISVAIITILIGLVMGKETFESYYDTKNGAFALVCACIWIGIFNSIRSICRERDIVRREHRTGLNLASYMVAHWLYEAALCAAEAVVVTLIVRIMSFDHFIEKAVFLPPIIEIYISFFLIIFSSDALALLISSVVRTENTAMTVMPAIRN